ncbi:MAG TPA: flagellar basal-body rod protein FlgG [Firmicutes bacterium]|nr:flagellar basal-body rod protein FlgG [Bacillota bacterium]
MIRSLWTAASGMLAQQISMDTIANNLANVNTSGFKKSRVDFKDLIYQKLGDNGLGTLQTPGSENAQVGNGVAPVISGKLFDQGTLENTGRPLDVAIQGEGFFAIRLPDGRTGYTRDGCFHIDSQGYLVTSDGNYVLYDGGNRLYISPEQASGEISISPDGRFTIGGTSGVYQLKLFKFANPEGLTAVGQNCFVESPSSGYAISGIPGSRGYGNVVQGCLERSNVSVIEEMVRMITVQRAYELNSKAIQSSDEMLGIANNLRR